ncbi:GntR family phosphonate transport system transcriptional regulator [Roseibium hamelinense]|uniref:GntR family phosphonate transport system transcriptional regulator n=1 Tax=Roseibium hamelinense TaxID=150831 RepID=A0A562SKS6_9HYPH|nr:phosphonate metabolism transcriptional regulator PhnF [Roseibium hamelinense]MTI43456.1 phosphonate metabolism transcriptional regulator PhnF [Roseibium hamelinense]TWI81917.1 GntR family phosphonate transport system transcriptional regulator [Roseibium hamelinense]
MTGRVNLDRGAGIAIWRQISEWLKSEIASGTFETGSRLPTEAEIAERFGVNRHTVRRAISELSGEGILRADQGRGTFVAAAPMDYPIGARTRFSDIVSGQNLSPDGRLIASAEEAATSKLARLLNVPEGTNLIRIEALRVADNLPMIIATSWLVKDRFPTFVADYEKTGSITKTLEKAGVPDYRRKESRISAERAQSGDAQYLEIEPGDPVLVVESVNVDPDGRPVQHTRARMVPGRIQLVVDS